MEKELYEIYLKTLKEELVCAMGCTEPIAIAYAAALAGKHLGARPEEVKIRASANIIKNVKSVVVPNTCGKKGIEAAAAIGIVGGNADLGLQVISAVSPEAAGEIDRFLSAAKFTVEKSEKPYVFHIQAELFSGPHRALVEIAGQHSNVIKIEKDGEILFEKPYEETNAEPADRYRLTVNGIVEFADCVEIADVKALLSRQIECNTAIALEGLTGKWGASVGKTLLSAYGDSVHNRAKAWAAAGSDARMNGCEMPVVINSGSGNQGITASIPVIIYARDMGASDELLYRALVVSNLVTVHMKTGIGRLSAYCGATSAGCGAGAGISYLHGGRIYEISHTIVNAVAINSGMICDGAKASCAAKIASAVEAGLLGWQMQQNKTQFYSGEGIITKGVENTIQNVGRVARFGMAQTDREIIDIMIGEKCR